MSASEYIGQTDRGSYHYSLQDLSNDMERIGLPSRDYSWGIPFRFKVEADRIVLIHSELYSVHDPLYEVGYQHEDKKLFIETDEGEILPIKAIGDYSITVNDPLLQECPVFLV